MIKPFLVLIFLVGILNSSFAQTAALTLTIQNLKSTKGNIVIGLYNKADGFAKDENAITGVIIAVTGTTVTYTFTGLPAADYAVALYHDVNSDNKLNTNLVGYPKENYGFSNNTFGAFGSIPDFKDAKVAIGEGEKKELVIVLR